MDVNVDIAINANMGIEWRYQYCKEKHENVDLSREDRDLFCANRNIGDFTYQFMEGFSKT